MLYVYYIGHIHIFIFLMASQRVPALSIVAKVGAGIKAINWMSAVRFPTVSPTKGKP